VTDASAANAESIMFARLIEIGVIEVGHREHPIACSRRPESVPLTVIVH
jgi:hypothetical protein